MEDEAENYSEDGGDNNYTRSDNATEDGCEEEDQDEESETDLGDGVLLIRAGKKGGSKRDRSDSLHAQGMQGLRKKKIEAGLTCQGSPFRTDSAIPHNQLCESPRGPSPGQQ